MRKAQREALKERIHLLLLKDPQSVKVIAERFGVREDFIREIAKKYNIKFPNTKIISRKDVKKFSENNADWGNFGITTSKGTKNQRVENVKNWKR